MNQPKTDHAIKEEGHLKEVREDIRRLGERKFQNMPAQIQTALEAIVDFERLKELRQRILDVGSWDELAIQERDIERLIRKKEGYIVDTLALLVAMVFVGFLAWSRFETVPETLLAALLTGVFVVTVSLFVIWWFNRDAAKRTPREQPFTGALHVTHGSDGKPTEAQCPKCRRSIKLGQGNGESWFLLCKGGFSMVYFPPARADIVNTMIKHLPIPLQPPPTRETSDR